MHSHLVRGGGTVLETIGGLVVMVILAAVGICVVWAFNHHGEMPWNDSGWQQQSAPPELVEQNAETEAMNRALEAFYRRNEKCTESWNKFIEESDLLTKEGQKSRLRECIALMEEVDPFYPHGVNPELASAIRRVREANIQFFETRLEEIDSESPNPRSKSLRQEVEKAETDLKKVVNKHQATIEKLKAKYDK